MLVICRQIAVGAEERASAHHVVDERAGLERR
jgi:hypothetical protein